VHLLLADVVMPGESGVELSARLRRQRPELAVLYISGYAEGSLPARSGLPAGASLLPKPFSSEALLGRVREVLDRPPRRPRRRSDPAL
jgi:DNA-binding response OmpR family regulator